MMVVVVDSGVVVGRLQRPLSRRTLTCSTPGRLQVPKLEARFRCTPLLEHNRQHMMGYLDLGVLQSFVDETVV